MRTMKRQSGSGTGYSGKLREAKPERFISVDIEADGPVPGPFSMLSLGAVAVDDPALTFYSELRPISDTFDSEALAVSGLDRELLKKQGKPPKEAIRSFGEWVAKVSGDSQPVFVAFNVPFDWAFVNHYFIQYGSGNPFGYSALDVKAYYMAAFKKTRWSDTIKPRLDPSIRPTAPHTHNALDDAIEQAEIFRNIRNRQDIQG